MAFIFNPNPNEGDKQTNPDTGVEYIYSGGAWRALGPKIEDEFDTLDERYVKLNGRSDVGDGYTIKGPGESGGTSTFHQIKDGKQYLYHVDTPQDSNTEWVANVSYVKSKTDDRMTKQGTQTVSSDHWKIIQPNQNSNNRTFVDIYDGSMNLYNVADPTDGADGWAANKKYVDDKVAGSGGGVPVGSIMMWINSIAPSGWLKLKGGSFDINAYPLLHAYLQQSDGYVSGKLPDWRGHYPGQIGDHLNGDVGIKLPQQTAKPSGGSPRSSSSFNNGENKTANKAGSSDFAGIRKGQVSIDSGWDEVTRPKTVAVHFIIKHD